jgi:hypothetical protein
MAGQMGKDSVCSTNGTVSLAGGEIEIVGATSRGRCVALLRHCGVRQYRRLRRWRPFPPMPSIQAYLPGACGGSKMRRHAMGADDHAQPTGQPQRLPRNNLTFCVQARPSADGCQRPGNGHSARAPDGANREASMKTCLVVDDSEVVRKVARRIRTVAGRWA